MPRRLPTLLVSAFLVTACDQGPQRPVATELAAEPVLFAPGPISSQGYDEYAVAFSADGSEVYFTRSSGGRRGRPRILVSRAEDGAWTEPEEVAFSTGWEEAPYLTRDGNRLLYSSRRDVPGWGPVRGNANLWMVDRTEDGGWSAPVPVSGDVNRPRVDGDGAPGRNETGPVVLSDGTLLYSTEEEPERGSDIYAADRVADGRWTGARPMLLNTSGDEAHPTISPDGRYLVFQGFRDVFATGDDLFVSERTEYGWSEPEPLPEPINGPGDEGWPRFSPDGSLLFFSSDRGGRRMSIWYVRVEAAGMMPPTPDASGEATSP
jgi:Tol biopolymer transport system component